MITKAVAAACLSLALLSPAGVAFAQDTQQEKAVEYVIQPGDTMWGLSKRFFNDPNYWPNLWANNPATTNPHFIFPGQKVRIYRDRVEIVPSTPQQQAAPAPSAVPAPVEEAIREKSFFVTGGEGFVTKDEVKPAGLILASQEHRGVVAEGDKVYTDVGANTGRVGDRFTIFHKGEKVPHPAAHSNVGYKYTPVGVLELTELTPQSSKAKVIYSYREITPGDFLLPYGDRRREVPLKQGIEGLDGYIIETLKGNRVIGEGEIVYLDLGTERGVTPGNLLYVVRRPKVEAQLLSKKKELPMEVIGAVVVVESLPKTSTGIVIKNADTIYIGDPVRVTGGTK